MTAVFWIGLASFGSSALAGMLAPQYRIEVFYGMLGPFLAVAVTWLLLERAGRANPAGVTHVLMAGFALKLLFFAVYVVAVMKLAGVDRVPFALSFFGYFVALYGVEALLLRRLTARLS